MAFVILPVALSWPLFLAACLACVCAAILIWMDRGPRLGVAFVLAAMPFIAASWVVIAVDCRVWWFLSECWGVWWP